MWLAALDMFDGNFFTPAFYGQSYNTHLESLLAVPFLFLGVPVYYSVPIATFLIFILPLLGFIWILFHREYEKSAIILLIFLLFLPIEWNFFVGLSRGFITGVAMVFLAAFLFLFRPNHWTAFMASFSIVLGFFFNPNMFLMVIIYVAYLIHGRNLKKFKFFIVPVIFGGLVALLYPSINFLFHKNNPEFVAHFFPQTALNIFNSAIFLENLNSFFKLYTPILYEVKFLFLPFFFLVGWFLYKGKKNIGFLLFTFLLLLMILLSYHNKIVDGSGSLYFANGRMFLALSFILPLIFSLGFQNQNIFKNNKIMNIIIALCIFHSVAKIGMINGRGGRAFKTNSGVVDVIKTKELQSLCNDISKMMKVENTKDLVVISKNDLINYGCPCFDRDLQTIHPRFERRQWVRNYYQKNVVNQFLVFSAYPLFDETKKLIKQDHIGFWYFINNENKTLTSFYKEHFLLFYLPNN
jgi:hypothetical protein